jgi:hypothetical protein
MQARRVARQLAPVLLFDHPRNTPRSAPRTSAAGVTGDRRVALAQGLDEGRGEDDVRGPSAHRRRRDVEQLRDLLDRPSLVAT